MAIDKFSIGDGSVVAVHLESTSSITDKLQWLSYIETSCYVTNYRKSSNIDVTVGNDTPMDHNLL